MAIFTSIKAAILFLVARSRKGWECASLTAKMGVVVSVGLLVLLVVFGYLGISASNQSTQQTLRERVTLVQMVANHLDYVIHNIEVNMAGIAEDFSKETDPFALDSKWLHSAYAQLKPLGSRVALVGNKGEIIQIESGAEGKHADLEIPEAIITQALSALEFTITDPYFSPDSHHVFVLASMPIFSQQDDFQGALVTEIDMMGPEIDNIWNPMTEITAGYMEIVSRDG